MHHHEEQSAAPPQHPGHILCIGGEWYACHLAYVPDIEQTQHHWSGSQQCLHHLQYSGNVAMVYTVQTFLSFQDRIALSCLLSSPPALQPRPKISNLKPFDIMTVKQTLIDYIYSRLNIRKYNTAHYMNIWYKMHTYHNILLKYAHI